MNSLSHLLIRSDAGSRIGIGHVMRCLAIARAWRARGGRVTYLSCCESDVLRRHIEAFGIGFVALEETHPASSDLETTQLMLEQLPSSWLVMDGYHFDSSYQMEIRAAGYRLVVIDDKAHLPYYHADVLLNQNINAERLTYRCDRDTILLLGTSYVLLRPEFLAWRDWRRTISHMARRVLVTMGGGDPDNVTLKVIEALHQAELPDLESVIIVGQANPHLDILQQVVKLSTGNMRVLANVIQMPELMAWADVAVSSAGGTCWELAFMGLPTLSLVVADNQREIAEELDTAGVTINMGYFKEVTSSTIARSLTALCNNYDRRSRLSHQGQQLVDGTGANRLVTLAHSLEQPPGKDLLEIRQATAGDGFQLWRMANDPGVRTNSFSSEPISLDSHLKWYKSKLASPDTCIWVVELSGVIVAQVRYERVEPGTAEIDFSVLAELRGKGLGAEALQVTGSRACDELNVKRVRGVVLQSNEASARAFVKSGFRKVHEGLVRGYPCYIFERDCSSWG